MHAVGLGVGLALGLGTTVGEGAAVGGIADGVEGACVAVRSAVALAAAVWTGVACGERSELLSAPDRVGAEAEAVAVGAMLLAPWTWAGAKPFSAVNVTKATSRRTFRSKRQSRPTETAG